MPSPSYVYGKEKSILITGASSGIGAELALHLAQYGGKIALQARRRVRLEAVAEQVRAKGASALVLEGDVTDPAQVTAQAAQLKDEQGPVDVAFLNAGLGKPTALTRFNGAKWRRMFEINVFGVINWLDALLPDMLQLERGIVAITSSLAGQCGLPGSGAYSATKAAVSTLAESLRVEARPRGIQISSIEPGFIRSELTEDNKFPMPFLMDTDEAVRIIADEVAEGAPVIRFPWQMSAAIATLRALPTPLYNLVGGMMVKKHK